MVKKEGTGNHRETRRIQEINHIQCSHRKDRLQDVRESLKFAVGDKVVTNGDSIGKVVRFTPSGKYVVVDFGTYSCKFRTSNGWEPGADVYSAAYIKPLTPEKEKEILDKEKVRACIRMFSSHEKTLSPEKAEKIMSILEE